MRHPSRRMTPNTVTIQLVTNWTKDLGGGRQPTYGTASDPVRCAVQPMSAEDLAIHARETEAIYHTVKFYADPGLRVRDRLNFGSRILTVLAMEATSGGAGRTYSVHCEEKPPGGN